VAGEALEAVFEATDLLDFGKKGSLKFFPIVKVDFGAGRLSAGFAGATTSFSLAAFGWLFTSAGVEAIPMESKMAKNANRRFMEKILFILSGG